ncbi:ABC transporter substrate-binding protein [Blautia sp. An81]|uniref:ABC transporter substrate-binding protein n=1 Tax=Blautia sp. An81 TaxID=1965659 RepID=UPI000B39889E|nr:extracellular solute-binding protein [Blautia sp. An81]OUN24985.1 sugar ABC transporter substrate-binding protein [Blautia sp. An81]
MKRRVFALALAGLMTFSMAACGNSGGSSSGGNAAAGTDEAAAEAEDKAVAGSEDAENKLVIWTLADDLKQFAEHYCEQNPDTQIETVVIAPADYLTKIQSAMRGKAKEPDIIVAEPQMLDTMYEAGYLEDLDQDPYNAQQYADNMVDYVWKAGQDADGVQRAISYQITPAAIYYRRDIAQKVFGTEDPEQIGQYFKDYKTILQTGETLKNAGYKIFASDGELGFFAGDSAWVVDGKLNVDQGRKDYMDLCIDLYQKDMTAYVASWSTTWYQGMSGPIPVIDSSTDVWNEEQMQEASESGQTTEVFAYGLPSWGVLTMRDHVGDLSGKWGVCAGPAYGFSGGTFLGINSLSEKKDLAWDFIQFVTTNEDTLDWWIETSQGDVVSWIPTIEKHKEDANEIYGGQKLYEFFLEQAEGIDYSKVTKYDKAIGDAWSAAITSIKTGEMDKETAINNFYDTVESTYPEIEVDR